MRVKIVHVITRLIIGGAQENTLLSCEGQHARGHDVTLITGPAEGPEGSLMFRAKSAGFRVIVVDEMKRSVLPVKDFRTYTRIRKLIADLKPDIVHTHSSKAGILGRHAADVCRVPGIIHTIHGLAFTASTSRIVNHVYRVLERQAAPVTDRIVCVADSMRDQSLAAGIGSPDQYVTVYSGMETRPFLDPDVPAEIMRDRLGISPHETVVGTVARLFHLKGHDDLLDIAADVLARHPNTRFLWVGDGILREHLAARADAMGLRDRFLITGMVPPDRVPSLVAAMDILVHPSRREGLARALPQAHLAGKPVITYNIDGAAEAVEHGVSGYLVDPYDIHQLQTHLEDLLASPRLCHALGKAGRATALARFDTQTMVNDLDHVYTEVLTGHPRNA
jgi:glycosyltransferase involved in cell wall biosynthesis